MDLSLDSVITNNIYIQHQHKYVDTCLEMVPTPTPNMYS